MEAYLAPLERVTACLPGQIKLHCYDRPRAVNDEGNWALGRDEAVDLGGGFSFEAAQRFKVIEVEEDRRESPRDRYRVTTLMYAYQLSKAGQPQFRLHWHPGGNSPEQRPHLHKPPNMKFHLVMSRATYEDAVEW